MSSRAAASSEAEIPNPVVAGDGNRLARRVVLRYGFSGFGLYPTSTGVLPSGFHGILRAMYTILTVLRDEGEQEWITSNKSLRIITQPTVQRERSPHYGELAGTLEY
jgi:hypothetical protein